MKLKFVIAGALAVAIVVFFLKNGSKSEENTAPLSKDTNSQKIDSAISTAPSPKPSSGPTNDQTVAKKVASPEEVAEFKALTAVALKQLPKITDVHTMPSNLRHATPPSIIRAASAIGEVEEHLKRNAGLASEGQNFYGNCIRNTELAKQVRALCLHYAWRLEKNHQVATQSGGTPDLDSLDDLASKL